MERNELDEELTEAILRDFQLQYGALFQKYNPNTGRYTNYPRGNYKSTSVNKSKPAGTSVSQKTQRGKTIVNNYDREYLSAVKRGDMEESQRMVDEVAKTAGYSVKAYHQTSSDFTVFNTDNPVAGRYDSETPSGIFFKTNDHDVGLGGKKQMAVFLNVGKFSVCINISL